MGRGGQRSQLMVVPVFFFFFFSFLSLCNATASWAHGDRLPRGDRPKTQVFLGAAAQDARWWARSGGVRHPHVSNNAGQAVEALISEMRVSRDLVSPPSSMVARFPDPERCWIRIGNLPGVCSKMVSWPGFALEPSGARGTMDGCFLCCHCQSRASQCQPVIHQPRMSSECNCRT